MTDANTGMPKEYLGDGVYVAVESGMFKLTTEDGIRSTNTIFLEPDVWEMLKAYTERAFDYYAHKKQDTK